MSMLMANNTSGSVGLIERLRAGDPTALSELFDRHRDRLRRMVDLRLDSRLQSRFHVDEILRDALAFAGERLDAYLVDAKLPIFLWLRQIVGEKLAMLHQQHLNADIETIDHGLSLYREALPEASSAALAAQLLGRHASPTQAAVRADRILRIQDALNALDPVDREVLTLRHFEQLTRREVALILAIEESTAAKRYIRALKKMKQLLADLPGGLDGI